MAFSTQLLAMTLAHIWPLIGFFLISVAKPGTTAVLYSPEFQGSVSNNCSVSWMCQKMRYTELPFLTL
jgi:hypothetical protein